MKFKQVYKVLLVALVTISSFCSVSAKSNISNNIIYNLEEKDGILVGQTLYKQEGKELSQYLKYNYVYDNQNRIVENNILRWDEDNNRWGKALTVRYQYDGQNVNTKSYIWDASRQEYKLIPQFNKQFLDTNL